MPEPPPIMPELPVVPYRPPIMPYGPIIPYPFPHPSQDEIQGTARVRTIARETNATETPTTHCSVRLITLSPWEFVTPGRACVFETTLGALGAEAERAFALRAPAVWRVSNVRCRRTDVSLATSMSGARLEPLAGRLDDAGEACPELAEGSKGGSGRALRLRADAWSASALRSARTQAVEAPASGRGAGDGLHKPILVLARVSRIWSTSSAFGGEFASRTTSSRACDSWPCTVTTAGGPAAG